MPPVTRVNSVAVSTARFAAVGKRLQQDDFVSMLVENDFVPYHIVGIQYLPHRQIVVVKFRRKEEYERFLGLESVKVNGIVCRLYDLSSQHTTVTIMGAPFEMEKEDITDLLKCYGEVKMLRQRLLSCEKNKNFNGLPDGTWLATMEVKSNIPSYIMVNETQLFITYFGQTKTCRLCNATTHLARDCNRGKSRPNLETTNAEFPTLEEANQETTQHKNNALQTIPQEKQTAITIETLITNFDQQEPRDSPVDHEKPQQEPRDSPVNNIEVPESTEVEMEPPQTTKVPHKARRALLQTESPSTSTQEPGMTLRPSKKRRKTPIKGSIPEQQPKEDLPPDSQLQFINMDQHYVFSFHTPCSSDTET